MKRLDHVQRVDEEHVPLKLLNTNYYRNRRSDKSERLENVGTWNRFNRSRMLEQTKTSRSN